MSISTDLEKQLETINTIDDHDVKPPGMPVNAFIKEGESLYAWCRADKKNLTARGLDWNRAELLPSCLGTLRLLQTKWYVERNTYEEALIVWEEKIPAAFDLRDTLLHDFRYAYRNDEEILGLIVSIAHSSSHADVIRDLRYLAELGKEYPAPLVAINYDLDLLGVVATKADMLSELLSLVNGDRGEQSEPKLLRDKAYTLCKDIMDEIRACGQYVFRRNPEREKGYTHVFSHRMCQKMEPGIMQES